MGKALVVVSGRGSTRRAETPPRDSIHVAAIRQLWGERIVDVGGMSGPGEKGRRFVLSHPIAAEKREWNRMVTTMQAILNEPS